MTENKEIEILKQELINIEDLIPDETNAKPHPEKQVEEIAKAIKEFGFTDPIHIDENNMILAGHGRLLALKKIGAKVVPCIRFKNFSYEKKIAYNLIHNGTTLSTTFNVDQLTINLREIGETLDMNAFGFDMAVLLPELTDCEEDMFDFDNELEKVEVPNAKLGDVYELGRHRLVCGDSTKEEYVKKLMNGQKADMCLTDPPYNVDYEGSNGLKIDNDNMSKDQFEEFLYSFYGQMKESVKKGGSYYIFHADTVGAAFRTMLWKQGITLRQTLIWVKNSMVLGRSDYHWRHEPILYGWIDGASHYFIGDRKQDTVIEDKVNYKKMTSAEKDALIKQLLADRGEETTIIHEDKPSVNDVHPTMKPLILCGRLIKNSSEDGAKVVDFFGGSGSTMMACEQLDRSAFIMEYDPRYVDVIIKRWETMTGQKAKKLN